LTDSQGILALVKNLYFYKQSKYINIQYYYIQDLEARKKITVSYIPTTSIIADRITKLLDRIAFQKFRELIGITTGTVQKDRRSYRLLCSL
jgi:hypothetical protein